MHDVGSFKYSVVLRIAETGHRDHLDGLIWRVAGGAARREEIGRTVFCVSDIASKGRCLLQTFITLFFTTTVIGASCLNQFKGPISADHPIYSSIYVNGTRVD